MVPRGAWEIGVVIFFLVMSLVLMMHTFEIVARLKEGCAVMRGMTALAQKKREWRQA